jgi:hypothetical protein
VSDPQTLTDDDALCVVAYRDLLGEVRPQGIDPITNILLLVPLVPGDKRVQEGYDERFSQPFDVLGPL